MIELHHLTVIDLSKSFGTVQALKNIIFNTWAFWLRKNNTFTLYSWP